MSGLPRSLVLSLCALTLAACAPDAAEEEMEVDEAAEVGQPAEAPAESPDAALAPFAGTWEVVAIMESGDTVPFTLTAIGEPASWTVTLPDREPMPLRIVSADDEELVTEMGPYPSLLREGVDVTVRQVARIEDGRLTGTMEAQYAGGDDEQVVGGTIEGSRTN